MRWFPAIVGFRDLKLRVRMARSCGDLFVGGIWMTVIDDPLYLLYRLNFGEILAIVVRAGGCNVYQCARSYKVYDCP